MLADMQFEWDAAKSRANARKHGMDFGLAVEAFADPYRLTDPSDGDYDEERWITIALVRSGEVVVISTQRGANRRIISARRRSGMNEESTVTVVFELDPENLPVLSDEHRAQLERLRTMKDEDIDFSDIPRTRPDAIWYRHNQVVPIDRDLMEHFGTDGRADAAKVNAALREYVAAHAKAS